MFRSSVSSYAMHGLADFLFVCSCSVMPGGKGSETNSRNRGVLYIIAYPMWLAEEEHVGRERPLSASGKKKRPGEKTGGKQLNSSM